MAAWVSVSFFHAKCGFLDCLRDLRSTYLVDSLDVVAEDLRVLPVPMITVQSKASEKTW